VPGSRSGRPTTELLFAKTKGDLMGVAELG
jgi:hypothetical protein